MLAPGHAHSKQADILITGIENSLWLGEQFKKDLLTLFPRLHVESESANKIIENPEALPVGPETAVLSISQSGQTFASLRGAAMLEEFRLAAKKLGGRGIGNLFIMTGEVDSLMGAAIGQRYQKSAPFNERIFVNGSGRRSAEPSSVAVAAAEQTLTEFLLRLAERIREEHPAGEPFGLKLTKNDLGVLRARNERFIQHVPYITGTDKRDILVVSPENQALLNAGKRWGRHITEGAIAWALGAA